MILVYFLLDVNWRCFKPYLIFCLGCLCVGYGGLVTSVGKERAILFARNYVVSVWTGFLFLLVLGIGCVTLLWHSLSLPYNYFVSFQLG